MAKSVTSFDLPHVPSFLRILVSKDGTTGSDVLAGKYDNVRWAKGGKVSPLSKRMGRVWGPNQKQLREIGDSLGFKLYSTKEFGIIHYTFIPSTKQGHDIAAQIDADEAKRSARKSK